MDYFSLTHVIPISKTTLSVSDSVPEVQRREPQGFQDDEAMNNWGPLWLIAEVIVKTDKEYAADFNPEWRDCFAAVSWPPALCMRSFFLLSALSR